VFRRGERLYQTRLTPLRADDGALVGAIAVAVDVTDERSRASEQAALVRFSEALGESGADLAATMDVTVSTIGALVGDAVVLRLTPDGDVLETTAAYHHDDDLREWLRELVARSHRTVSEGLHGYVQRTGKPIFLPELEVDRLRDQVLPEHAEFLDRMDARSLMVAPLHVRGAMVGSVIVTRDGSRPAYDSADLDLLVDICSRAALAVSTARAYADLRVAALQRQRLLDRLVRVQEEERRRIAADIHDDTIQVLFAIDLRIQLLRRNLQSGAVAAAEADPELARIQDDYREAVTRLREMIFQLQPAGLGSHGLAPAVEEYARRLFDGAPTRVRIDDAIPANPGADASGMGDPVVPAIAYRICQEALTNVRRHAGASEVEVALAVDGAALELRITDDGVGLPPDAFRPRAGHLGLPGMREQAELAGGSLSVQARPGGGTVVHARLPLATSDAAVDPPVAPFG
jgi:signal transduction histidine kinase